MPQSSAVRSLLIVYNVTGPTTTVRGFQFADSLAAAGIRTEYAARTPAWVMRLSSIVQHRWWAIPLRGLVRLLEPLILRRQEKRILRRARSVDAVLMLCARSWRLHDELWRQGTRIVTDFSDALWLPHYRTGYERLHDMLRQSHAVSCENDYLRDYARPYNARLHLTPDAPQLEAFDLRRPNVVRARDQLVLGWIGGIWAAENLYSIFEPLETLFARHPHLHLRILGASMQKLPRFEHVRFSCQTHYTNAQMIDEALKMDIGLFPLYRTEDSRTRGTLKAKIYMSAGAVAVCQDWGGIGELIENGRNGVLCNSADDWLASLDRLVTHPDERARIAAAGLDTIRSTYSLAACTERLKAVLETL